MSSLNSLFFHDIKDCFSIGLSSVFASSSFSSVFCKTHLLSRPRFELKVIITGYARQCQPRSLISHCFVFSFCKQLLTLLIISCSDHKKPSFHLLLIYLKLITEKDECECYIFAGLFAMALPHLYLLFLLVVLMT